MKFKVGDWVTTKDIVDNPNLSGRCGKILSISYNENLVNLEDGTAWLFNEHELEAHGQPMGDIEDEPTEGLRYNKGKVDLTQLSPVAQILESLVYMYGSCKYDVSNFKKFKPTEEQAYLEFLQCAKRHLMKYEQGQFFDDESKMPHLTHIVWNLNRILDLYYHGLTHMKDGKDLYQQPLRVELPPVPTKDNFKELWGFEYQPHKKG